MIDFAGFDDWVEIFAGGLQVDSLGRQTDGDRLIDNALATFDPAHHEPPLVVGHPRDNSPAFGWVEAIRPGQRQGKKLLLAKFKQVDPDFADLAMRGAYKKRSASFYPNGRLRHVGFLGGQPPAVKGLADLKFDDSEDFQEFTQPINEESTMEIKEFFEALKIWKKETQPEAPAVPPLAEKRQDGASTDASPAQFSEADIQQAKAQAAAEARAQAEREFAEKAAQAERQARSREIKTWCDTGVASGKIAPAWVKSGLPEFMEQLADQPMEFGDAKTQKAPLQWFQEFMDGLPKLVEFGEIASRDKDVSPSGDPLDQMNTLALAKMQATPGMSFTEALVAVNHENPSLWPVKTN